MYFGDLPLSLPPNIFSTALCDSHGWFWRQVGVAPLVSYNVNRLEFRHCCKKARMHLNEVQEAKLHERLVENGARKKVLFF